MPALLKPLVLATLLALVHQAQAIECAGNVMLGSMDSGVADRDAGSVCINDLILDDDNLWGSHERFVKHVQAVANDLGGKGVISGEERRALSAAAVASEVGKLLTVKVIAFNDFHGNIDGTSLTWSGTPAGGVDWLAGHVAKLKEANPNSVVVSAGDLIGATPLVSALFHDEPTIEAMNRLGLDFNAVGNHEFDEGKDELLRMQDGGCHPSDANSCKGNEVGTPYPFEGAKFRFLAANVIETATGKPLFAAYRIRDFKGHKVAFIGMTLENTPSIVTPSGVAGLEFKDEADTVNALIPTLKAQGVEAIVVLVHEGGYKSGGISECTGVSGPIVDIVNRFDDEIDLVITGHTHQAYVCSLANAAGRLVPVTSGGSNGRLLTDIDLTLDTASHEVAGVTATNFIADHSSVSAEASLTTLVANYQTLAAPVAGRVIGAITADLPSSPANAAGELVLGDFIADAQFNATRGAGFGEAVVAFMNPGGIRSPGFLYAQSGSEGDGNVTYGEAFTVQPFGNSLVTLTLSGAQIETLLEQQFVGCPNGQTFNRILQVSDGFSYTWDNAGPACDKVDPASILLNGAPIDPAASYRVTVNSFLADGGDLFTVLKEGTDRLGGAQDIDALEAWFATFATPVDPAGYANALSRILRRN